jgi:hypothetical protein
MQLSTSGWVYNLAIVCIQLSRCVNPRHKVQHELQEAEVVISLRPAMLNPPWIHSKQWRVGALKTFLRNLIIDSLDRKFLGRDNFRGRVVGSLWPSEPCCSSTPRSSLKQVASCNTKLFTLSWSCQISSSIFLIICRVLCRSNFFGRV